MQNEANSTRTVNGDGGADSVDLASLASMLQETLDLRLPPVALAFVTELPAGVKSFSGEVFSACTFWRRGEERVFFAPAAAHHNCPVGAFTMGFSMTEEQKASLMEAVSLMGQVGYVQPEEAANIPTLQGEQTGSGIVYGPLEIFPVGPDAVLVWVSAAQAMLLEEATGASVWTAEQTGTPSFGRPSCAAIAAAVTRQEPVFSLGCTGMRIYTEVDADLQLAVLPGGALPGLHDRLAATASANDQMAAYYMSQKKRLTPDGVH